MAEIVGIPFQEVTQVALIPVAYTLGGIAVATAIAFVPFVDRRTKATIGAALPTIGAAIDAMRYLTGNSYALGDGMAYDVVPLSGYGNTGALAMNISGYGSASLADAAYSGGDMDSLEGNAALGGPMMWRKRFGGVPKIARSVNGGAAQPSPFAGRHGHRWGWLIKLVGFGPFQQIAAMPKDKRTALIEQLRADALATVQAAQSAEVAVPQTLEGLGGYDGMIAAGAAY